LTSGRPPFRGGLSSSLEALPTSSTAGSLWEVNNAGVATNRGALLTATGRVSMAHNGTQVMIVDGTYGYIYNIDDGLCADR
jgi:hypothetical protein